jgi:plastocyanin
MTRGRWILAIVAVVLVLAAAGAWLVLRNGALSADRKPRAIEAAMARRLINLSIPASQRRASNPFAAPDAWRSGSDAFRGQCAMCHGNDGRGHTPIGPHMYPPVPDLAASEIQQFSDGALFSIIQHGVAFTGMPSFRSANSDEQIWRLVAFVRHVPQLTEADLAPAQVAAPSAAPPADHKLTIAVDGTAFQLGDVTVAVGDTITWVNKDPFPHNVTSKDGGFRSKDLDPDESFRFTAKKPGTYHYVCTLHPTMAAVIHVK